MKFNPNCVRDILIECERAIEPYVELYIEESDIPDSLSKYSWSELLYHLEQCKLSGLFADKSYEDTTGAYRISDLSPKGHELLNQICKDKIWKKIIKKGILSLPQLIEIAISSISLFQSFDGDNLAK